MDEMKLEKIRGGKGGGERFLPDLRSHTRTGKVGRVVSAF